MRVRPTVLTMTLLGASALAACGAKPATVSRAECVLARADSALLEGGPVYHDCAVDRPAEAIARPFRMLPGSTTSREGCLRAVVQFVVGADGRPEHNTIRIVSSDDRDLANSLAESVAAWRYRPALLADAPVRQIVREQRAVFVAVSVRRAGSPPPSTPPANARTCK